MLQEKWSFTSLKYIEGLVALSVDYPIFLLGHCVLSDSAAVITSRSLLIWSSSMHAIMNPEKPDSFVPLGTSYATGLPSICGASNFDYDNPCLDYFLSSFTEGECFFNASCIPPTSVLSLLGVVHLLSNQLWEEGKLGEDVTQWRRVSCLSAAGHRVPVL